MAYHLSIYAETLNLAYQFAILFLLFYGYRAFRRRDLAKHANAMAVVMFLNFVSIFTVMIPDFAAHATNFLGGNYELDLVGIFPHAIMGTVAQSLAAFTFTRWIHNGFMLSGCGGRTLMRVVIYIWGIAAVTGIVVYSFHLLTFLGILG